MAACALAPPTPARHPNPTTPPQGREGKVTTVYRRKYVVHVERITRDKVNGEGSTGGRAAPRPPSPAPRAAKWGRAAAAAAKAQLVAQGAIVKSVDEEDGRPAGVRAGVRPPAVAPPGGGGGTPTPSPGVPASPGARGLAALQLPPAARPFSDGDASGGLARQDSGAGVLTSPQQGPMSPDGAAAPSPAAESGNGSGSVMSPLAAAASAAAGPGALRPGGPLSPQSAAAAAAAAGQGAPSGGRLGAWMAGAPAAAAGEPGKPGPGGKGPAAAGAAPVATGQQQKGAMEEMAAPAGGAVVPAGGSPAAQAAPSAPPPAAAAAAGEGADTPAPAAPPPGAAGALASADALADGVAGLSLDSSASGAAAFEVLSRLAGQDLGLGQLSTAPVGVAGSGAPASGGPMPALGVLDAAFRTGLPQPVDSDWARSRPRHPVATPPSFPRSSPEIMSAPGLFRRMDPEALFFAFYYQPDTYQQYLAAQELKRQSWRYHKHHNAWFQRYAEPSVTNDEYEQGTYVYFDFHVVHDDLQSGWCYRRKVRRGGGGGPAGERGCTRSVRGCRRRGSCVVGAAVTGESSGPRSRPPAPTPPGELCVPLRRAGGRPAGGALNRSGSGSGGGSSRRQAAAAAGSGGGRRRRQRPAPGWRVAVALAPAIAAQALPFTLLQCTLLHASDALTAMELGWGLAGAGRAAHRPAGVEASTSAASGQPAAAAGVVRSTVFTVP